MSAQIFDSGPRDVAFDAVIFQSDHPEATVAKIDEINARLQDGYSCWRDPGVERRGGSQIEGNGLFAKEDFPKDTIVAIKGGRVVNEDAVRELTASGELHGSQQQVYVNEFIVGLTPDEEDENLVGYNHSCDPNAMVIIPSKTMPIACLVLRRDIKAGEEITVDYSVSNLSNTHRLICKCGSPQCRGIIQPHYDWASPEFQERYAGEFPGYVQEVMNRSSDLPEEQRRDALSSVLYAGMSGVVSVLADELDKRPEQDEDLSAALKKAVARFGDVTQLFMGEDTLRAAGIERNHLATPEGTEIEFDNIVAFARKIDNLCGWITEEAA